MDNKGKRVLGAVSLALIVIIVGIVAVPKLIHQRSSVGPPPISTPTTAVPNSTTGTVQSPSSPPPANTFNVVSYGADPTGVKDSTAAIRSAIVAAEAKPGSEVYFPAGRFLLDQPSTNLFDFVIRQPIQVVGAGIGATTIVNEIGQKTPGVRLSTDIFAIEVAQGTQTGGGSGTSISNMTLDSATYDAGTDIMDFANHTTLSNLKVLAARSTNSYNYNSFGVRVIAICNPSTISTIYRVDNVINNVTIIGQGQEGTTELDLSCQVGTTASNINIVGNGIDIFYCNNDTLTNANLTGGSDGSTHYYTWVVTGSSNITLSNIVTNGIGGVIAPDISLVSHNITVSNETMQNKSSYLYVGDSRNVSIQGSSLGGIAVEPKYTVAGLSITNTSYIRTLCKPGTSITGLIGMTCPAA